MITDIPESVAVTKFFYDIEQPLDANQKLMKSDQALAVFRRAGVAQVHDAYENLNKGLEAHRAKIEANTKEWEKSKLSFEKVQTQMSSGLAKFREELGQTGMKLGGMFADMALGFAVDVVKEGITGIADALGLIDLPTTQATVDTVEALAEADTIWSEAAAKLAPQLQAQVDATERAEQVTKDYLDAQKELEDFLNRGTNATVEYNTKFAILVDALAEGRVDADGFAEALQHITDELLESSGAADKAVEGWNRAFKDLQRQIALNDREFAKSQRAAKEARGFQLEYAQGSSTPTEAYLIEQAARDRDAELEQERLDQLFADRLASSRIPPTFLEGGYGRQFDSSALGGAGEESPLIRALGPIEEFDAYTEAFDALSGAATAAYEALVTGSMGAGAAIKAFSADLALSIGKRSVLRAAEEVALAIAEPWAAGRHLAAAAKFAGVAVLAGATAAALGSGGGGGNDASSSAPAYTGGGSSGQPSNTTTNIYYGDSFAHESHRGRQLMIEREDRERIGGGAGVN